MAKQTGGDSAKNKLSIEAKLELFQKVEIPISGSKEKVVNYVDKDVEITAIDGCKHMVAGEKYTVGSSTAVILIERCWAKIN